jgi:ribose transport system substrate-binding protein
MCKLKFIVVLCLAAIFVVTIVILPGCKEEAAETTLAPETVIVKETVVETVIQEVEKESPYTYEKLREMAKAGAYEGEPAKGHKLAFANFLASFSVCQLVEQSIKEQWALAGGAEEDLIILDNAYDSAIAVQNADIVFNKKPEVFIQFQFDSRVNAMIAKKASELEVFMIGIDVPVPGFPFMGVNNYGASVLMGEYLVDQIPKVYGSWDNVDLMIYPWNPPLGDTVKLRMLGSIDTLVEAFGESANPGDVLGQKPEGSKTVIIGGGSVAAEAQAETTNILNANPNARNIIFFALDDQVANGGQAAADILKVWDPEKWLVVSQGCDELGVKSIRNGIIDADVAYFFEKYGEYCVPGALAQMYGNPVPAAMYVENVVLTKDNIDEYYPE